MSLADTLWLLPVLGGLALGTWLRWTAVSLLLGLAFVVLSLVLFGYSLDHYDEQGYCEAGAPCPTGAHVIQYWPVAFLVDARSCSVASVGRSGTTGHSGAG